MWYHHSTGKTLTLVCSFQGCHLQKINDPPMWTLFRSSCVCGNSHKGWSAVQAYLGASLISLSGLSSEWRAIGLCGLLCWGYFYKLGWTAWYWVKPMVHLAKHYQLWPAAAFPVPQVWNFLSLTWRCSGSMGIVRGWLGCAQAKGPHAAEVMQLPESPRIWSTRATSWESHNLIWKLLISKVKIWLWSCEDVVLRSPCRGPLGTIPNGLWGSGIANWASATQGQIRFCSCLPLIKFI